MFRYARIRNKSDNRSFPTSDYQGHRFLALATGNTMQSSAGTTCAQREADCSLSQRAGVPTLPLVSRRSFPLRLPGRQRFN